MWLKWISISSELWFEQYLLGTKSIFCLLKSYDVTPNLLVSQAFISERRNRMFLCRKQSWVWLLSENWPLSLERLQIKWKLFKQKLIGDQTGRKITLHTFLYYLLSRNRILFWAILIIIINISSCINIILIITSIIINSIDSINITLITSLNIL